jgi:transcriptional regulator with GAF, ATPase, and Fis domain
LATAARRSDLYYRLGVFPIHLPPLRERREDLPLLVRHYLRRFSRELGRDVQEVAPEVLGSEKGGVKRCQDPFYDNEERKGS